jgi:hypothetical protein
MRSGVDLVTIQWCPAGSGYFRLLVVEEWLRMILVQHPERAHLAQPGRGDLFDMRYSIDGSANSDKELAEPGYVSQWSASQRAAVWVMVFWRGDS